MNLFTLVFGGEGGDEFAENAFFLEEHAQTMETLLYKHYVTLNPMPSRICVMGLQTPPILGRAACTTQTEDIQFVSLKPEIGMNWIYSVLGCKLPPSALSL